MSDRAPDRRKKRPRIKRGLLFLSADRPVYVDLAAPVAEHRNIDKAREDDRHVRAQKPDRFERFQPLLMG